MRKPLKDPVDYIKPGRPRKQPPRDAATRILQLAKEGYSVKGIAYRLQVSLEIFNRWLDENADLQRALDEGREREHKDLFNALYTAANKGNVTAAIFLLKARHGYREGDQSEIANRVSVTFHLPGAIPLDQFKVIEHEPDRVEQLPAKSAAGSRRA